MPEIFHCPECGKEYPRENRLIGKAVACECGHRFLVPPREPAATPLSGVSLGPGPRPVSPAQPTRPNQVAGQKPARWADPLPPNEPAGEPTPLTEADLIDETPERPAPPRQAYVATPAVVVPYHGNAVGPPSPGAALPATPQQSPPGTHRPVSKPTTGGATTMGAWVFRIVVFVFLPTAVVCSALAFYLYSRHGRTGAPTAVSSPAGASPAAANAGGAKGEPFPAGKLVTIWDGKKISRGGLLEFSLEYRLDGLSTSPETKYFWVVVDRSDSKVEFPIPADLLKPRDRLSGQPKGISEAQFPAPYNTHLERQSPGMSQREIISNEIQISGS